MTIFNWLRVELFLKRFSSLQLVKVEQIEAGLQETFHHMWNENTNNTLLYTHTFSLKDSEGITIIFVAISPTTLKK